MKKQPLATSMKDIDNENKLIEGLINNNDLAYEALVRQYGAKMYTVAWRFFSTDDDAQECLQKAFIQVFKNIPSFKKNSNLSTWLHRITVNEALMMLRQKKRQHTSSLETFYQQYNDYGERTVFADNLGHSLSHNLSNNIEMIFEKGETKLSLNELIYQLPEKYCNVILLRDIQELSTKETAEILAISEASVKTQLHRARLLLKAILEQEDKESAEKNWTVN
ncbi:RNA polymerase sigma factor [Colwellia hornerae]|uniref:Sigma-70 family RNA polymerase sigma factor n=1 Tax=Colwellia hornerae TaxID=89402 RepID=A0A5C6Q2L1_9GAMM|nr:sigma-70 family RNA polymerase sigma factor [Colwellia hornerae]TWX46546.1 sigma-70 family RNA polymerase sigma factor [Colwellia hornerae]TWX54294.1 sigma-70 family RNA polymerase sigma factor [Colwellia hornerae]TWX63071.1 sigma-70 family RNA polymerase sigma factor [Colwellia hornerae]